MRTLRATDTAQSRTESDSCVTGVSGVGPASNLAYQVPSKALQLSLVQLRKAFQSDGWSVSNLQRWPQTPGLTSATMQKSFDSSTACGNLQVEQGAVLVTVNVSDGISC